MCQLLETIKVENRKFVNLKYHQLRMNRSYNQIFGCENKITLSNIEIPKSLDNNMYRCRVVYSRNIEDIQFLRQEERVFSKLKLVYCNNISYNHKYSNREVLIELLVKAKDFDEIVIVKNNFVTDCSIGNLIFKKENKWYTPDSPLLNGTQRQKLIDTGIILLAEIKVENICEYESVAIINALIDFEAKREIPIDMLCL